MFYYFQVEDGKLNGNVNMGSRKLPNFVNWNWPIIRKFLLWVVVSVLMAAIAAIAAMVVLIPKTCNPDLPWYQSKVFYEVSLDNFQDSNNDGIGDIKGLISKLNDIQEFHVSAIRLYHIFDENSLLKIDSRVGTLEDFQSLVLAVHARNMSLILDMPVLSLATPVSSPNINTTHTVLLANDSLISYFDDTSAAIAFWSRAQNVDGFYLKSLEKHVDDVNFGKSLQLWKQIIGFHKILIASEQAMEKASGSALNILLNRIDLVDISLDLRNGIDGLKNKINEVVSGPLWSKPHYPWPHWTVGKGDRISSSISNINLTLTAMQFALPGTVNIYFTDEIGLGYVPRHDVESHPNQALLDHQKIDDKFESSSAKGTNKNLIEHDSITSINSTDKFIETLKNFAEVHINTPTISIRAILKDGNVLKNTAIRETDNSNLIVVERWYPRRNTCVFVGNLGNEAITTDLSTMFYGGTVIASTNSSIIGQVVYFNEITFAPNSAMILRLEK